MPTDQQKSDPRPRQGQAVVEQVPECSASTKSTPASDVHESVELRDRFSSPSHAPLSACSLGNIRNLETSDYLIAVAKLKADIKMCLESDRLASLPTAPLPADLMAPDSECADQNKEEALSQLALRYHALSATFDDLGDDREAVRGSSLEGRYEALDMLAATARNAETTGLPFENKALSQLELRYHVLSATLDDLGDDREAVLGSSLEGRYEALDIIAAAARNAETTGVPSENKARPSCAGSGQMIMWPKLPVDVSQRKHEDTSTTPSHSPHAITDAALERSEQLLAELLALNLPDEARKTRKSVSMSMSSIASLCSSPTHKPRDQSKKDDMVEVPVALLDLLVQTWIKHGSGGQSIVPKEINKPSSVQEMALSTSTSTVCDEVDCAKESLVSLRSPSLSSRATPVSTLSTLSPVQSSRAPPGEDCSKPKTASGAVLSPTLSSRSVFSEACPSSQQILSSPCLSSWASPTTMLSPSQSFRTLRNEACITPQTSRASPAISSRTARVAVRSPSPSSAALVQEAVSGSWRQLPTPPVKATPTSMTRYVQAPQSPRQTFRSGRDPRTLLTANPQQNAGGFFVPRKPAPAPCIVQNVTVKNEIHVHTHR